MLPTSPLFSWDSNLGNGKMFLNSSYFWFNIWNKVSSIILAAIKKSEGSAAKMKKAAMKLKKESSMKLKKSMAMMKKSMATMKKASAMKMKMKKK